MLSQCRRICCGDNREVGVLGNVVSDSVYAVDPSRTHRTRPGLTFPVHQVINHQRPAYRAEQFAQTDGSYWRVARIQVDWTFYEFVVLHGRTRGKMSTPLGYALPLAHQFNFS